MANWNYFITPESDQMFIRVRCCKPSDLTYTLDLEKQLKTKSLSKIYLTKNKLVFFTKLRLFKQF